MSNTNEPNQSDQVSAWNILRRYRGLADSETQSETAAPGLNAIREASNETSQSSSRKASVFAPEPSATSIEPSGTFTKSTWWFWNGENAATNGENTVLDRAAKENTPKVHSDQPHPPATTKKDSKPNTTAVSGSMGSFFSSKSPIDQPIFDSTNGPKTDPQAPSKIAKTSPKEPQNAAKIALQDPLQPLQDTQLNEPASWSPWPSTYVSSWTSYTYSRAPQNGATTESTPLLADQNAKPPSSDSKSNSDADHTAGRWFSWFWPSNPLLSDTDDESFHGNTANTEHFKAAKLLIETFKDSVHYAIKKGPFEAEIAVSGTQTETNPAKYNPKKNPLTSNEVQERSLVTKTTEPLAPPTNSTSISAPSTPNPNSFTTNGSPRAINSSSSSVRLSHVNGITSVLESAPHDAVLPQLDDNLRTITLRTRLRLIAEHWLYRHNSSEKHIYRKRAEALKPRNFKRVLVIGVHGFLPTKMVRSLIGQSTGSSVKFVQKASEAVDTWFDGSGLDYSVETIALEGEGRIEDRVSNLYKLLVNWSHLINDSDVIFIAAHSQGVPVGVHLLAKMLTGGQYHLKHKKVGFLSMAGVNCGPFIGLDLKLVIRAYTSAENEIISEIFEFQKAASDQSLSLNQSMRVLLSHNVKITMAGALEDQFIPLYSSLGLNFHHPNIFRCTYVSSRGEVPAFVSALFKIAITMKNLGFGDHGVFRDLGDRCQGPISDRGGHGRIFDSESVYLQALRHTLETTDLQQPRELVVSPAVALAADADGSTGQMGLNLYHLPWNMRGMIHDLVGVKNIAKYTLLHELMEEFTKWEPTKTWRDVKYCFDALEDMDVSDLLM